MAKNVPRPDELDQYHIAGAAWIPLDELASRLNVLPRHQEIVVVCHSGNRSAEGLGIPQSVDLNRQYQSD